MQRLVVLVLMVTVTVTVTACTPITSSSRLLKDCAADTSAPVTALAPDQYAALAGRFRLIQVDNSDSLTRPYAASSQLTLQMADSAERARSRARRIPFRTSDRQLVGIRRWTDPQPDDSAEVSEAALYLGCRECMDASPETLRIQRITTTGFSGTWAGRSGIGIRVTAQGRVLPDASGYFCAERLDDRSLR
jgi:hypothetical protein